MDIHRSEEEQIEALKAWWAENGRSAVFGVVLGLGAIFGYRHWQAQELAAAESASMQYQQMLVAMQQPGSDALRTAAEALAQSHPDGTYGAFASMALAMTAADAGDLDKAAALLETARKENQDPVVDQELRLRLAQVRNAQGRPDDALALLAGNAGKEYAIAFDELRGDVEAARGNTDAARGAWERALAALRAEGADAALLELKLDNLGRDTRS